MVWGEFFDAGNPGAPARCAVHLRVETAETCLTADPAPGNDPVPLELNVFDRNDADAGAVHESFIASAEPVALRIVRGAASAVRPVSVRVDGNDG